jgi:ribosomal protein S18 acetylase RimI-like enzyme
MKETRDGYTLSDDPSSVDLDAVCELLRDTYWASNRSRAMIALTLQNSLCFTVRFNEKQVGLARVLTDRGGSSYVCDVVIHPEHQQRGLGRWLMGCLLQHPAVVNTRALLLTRDAQAFYRELGFVTHPYECMVKSEPS